MNLKFTNEVRGSTLLRKPPVSSVKEERRRTGRYIAILVGICLLLVAIYHAWVRRIPVVASLVIPALIMFVYVGWVLYTASRDKKRLLLLDAEAALQAAADQEEVPDIQPDISIISIKENRKETDIHRFEELSPAKENGGKRFVTPIILVNDKPAEDLDEKWTQVLETLFDNDERLRRYQRRRKLKRRFCRSRRYAAFKRSYSIG